jgi:hypothetical protein
MQSLVILTVLLILTIVLIELLRFLCAICMSHWLVLCFCSDVALVTSLRDGMNLVSYEYVACQGSKKGALILSEVTGQLFLSYFSFPLHGRICNL